MDVDGLAAARERFLLLHAIVRAIVKSSKPYIAAVEGWAAGAGFSLALCCDTIVAGTSARFIAAFPKVGLVGDAGLLHTLPARVGLGRARQILLYARPVDAEAALGMGMIDESRRTERRSTGARTRSRIRWPRAALDVSHEGISRARHRRSS